MNILILKEGDLGSTIMLTPTIKALNKQGHNVYLIICAGPESSNITNLLYDFEYIEGVRGFDSTRERNGDHTIAWIMQKDIDMCLESYPAGEGFKWLYPYLNCASIRRAPKNTKDIQHEVDVNLGMVRDLISGDCSSLYNVPRYKIDTIDDLFLPYKNKIKVIICPNYKKDGIDIKKHWGVKNYARLINLLADDYQAILIDDSDGIGVCNYIKHLAPKVLNWAGMFTIKECIAAMNFADVIIANNSYFAHIATGIDRPLMAFFDTKSLELSRPIGPKAIILKAEAPEHNCASTSAHDGCFCIGAIPADNVYNAIVKYILPEIDKEKKVQPVGV
jgi:ADP-heptose:LPS heptosyltransferase